MPRSRSRKATPPRRTSTPSPAPFPTLQAFIDCGGHIDVGRIHPIECAAIANDEHRMYVALQRRSGETLMALLARLDTSLKHCLDHDEFVDEINPA